MLLMTVGSKWSYKEELELLDEINENKTVKQIAEKHERTIGGINSRIHHIAYNMYKNDIPINEIENKTRLNRRVKKNVHNNEEIYEKLKEMEKRIEYIKKIIISM